MKSRTAQGSRDPVRHSWCATLLPFLYLYLLNVSIPIPTHLGHSERRTLLHESSTFIAQKTKAALAHGLGIILCVGETLAEREAERTDEVVREQLGEVVKELSADVSGWK